MSTPDDTLTCGVRVPELNALLDYRSGAHDALAPLAADRLDAHVSACPYCRQTVEALTSLHQVSKQLVDTETEAAAQGPWLDRLLHTLTLESRPGRMIPLAPPSQARTLDQTEGSLRALIRNRVDDADTLVLSTSFIGDVTAYGAPVRVHMTLHVRLGASIPDTVARARRTTRAALAVATGLALDGVDITVADAFADVSEVTA